MTDDLFTATPETAPAYVEVAVHEPVQQLYTYSLPAELRHLAPGSIVEVPFGRRHTRACVVRLLSSLPSELAAVKMKPILREVTPGFPLPLEIVQLARCLSD